MNTIHAAITASSVSTVEISPPSSQSNSLFGDARSADVRQSSPESSSSSFGQSSTSSTSNSSLSSLASGDHWSAPVTTSYDHVPAYRDTSEPAVRLALAREFYPTSRARNAYFQEPLDALRSRDANIPNSSVPRDPTPEEIERRDLAILEDLQRILPLHVTISSPAERAPLFALAEEVTNARSFAVRRLAEFWPDLTAQERERVRDLSRHPAVFQPKFLAGIAQAHELLPLERLGDLLDAVRSIAAPDLQNNGKSALPYSSSLHDPEQTGSIRLMAVILHSYTPAEQLDILNYMLPRRNLSVRSSEDAPDGTSYPAEGNEFGADGNAAENIAAVALGHLAKSYPKLAEIVQQRILQRIRALLFSQQLDIEVIVALTAFLPHLSRVGRDQLGLQLVHTATRDARNVRKAAGAILQNAANLSPDVARKLVKKLLGGAAFGRAFHEPDLVIRQLANLTEPVAEYALSVMLSHARRNADYRYRNIPELLGKYFKHLSPASQRYTLEKVPKLLDSRLVMQFVYCSAPALEALNDRRLTNFMRTIFQHAQAADARQQRLLAPVFRALAPRIPGDEQTGWAALIRAGPRFVA